MNDIKNKRKKGFFKKIFGLFEILLTIIIILICTTILVQRISGNEKSVFGYRLFKIETGSMIPKYNINDVILVKEVNLENINIGDDLVYIGTYGQQEGKTITHQVINKKNVGDQTLFYTKGIANDTPDPVVYSNQIIGTVQAKVYTLTWITNMLLNIYGLYFLIILPILITIFFSAIHSQDKKEKYLQKRMNEDRKELEKEKKKEKKLKEKNKTEKSKTKKATDKTK